MTAPSRGEPAMKFAESEEDVRCLYDSPSDLVLQKCLPALDEHCVHFIAHSPFLCIGTADADGPADISPRGDAPGFVRVLDQNTLLIPDRLGNNRLDSMSNLTRNPHVALIFFVPGVDETLRVNGLGRVVVESGMLAACTVNGKTPKSAILVAVKEAFLQCAKALKRSKLWSDDYRITRDKLPTFGQMLVDQTDTKMTAGELDEVIDNAYRNRLY